VSDVDWYCCGGAASVQRTCNVVFVARGARLASGLGWGSFQGRLQVVHLDFVASEVIHSERMKAVRRMLLRSAADDNKSCMRR
jgi:hypothetical protein